MLFFVLFFLKSYLKWWLRYDIIIMEVLLFMITVFQKNEQEIIQERFYRHILNDPSQQICPTYLQRKSTGEKVDTSDLTEDELIAIIKADIQDYSTQNGSYGSFQNPNRRKPDVFNLAHALQNRTYSDYFLFQLFQLSLQDGYHMISDIIGALGLNQRLFEVKAIAKFQKECSGDFRGYTTEDMLQVLMQMVQNEKNKLQKKKR